MKTKTSTRTEYAVCVRTKEGHWIPISPLVRYHSRIEAERAKAAHEANYMGRTTTKRQVVVTKRQVTITRTEWEEVEV